MRKSARLGAALLGVVLGVPACSRRRGSPGTDRDRITLSYAVWDNNQKPVMEELGKEFTRTHPNITINVQLTPWADYWTKLKAAATRRSGARRLLDERPQLPALRLQRRDPAARGADHQDGWTCRSTPSRWWTSTPTRASSTACRRTWTRSASGTTRRSSTPRGAYPADDWTWADFQAAAAKLTDPAKGVYGTAAQLDGLPGIPVQHHRPGRRLRDLPGRQEVRLRRPARRSRACGSGPT